MIEVLEILIAVLAAFGLYTVLDMVRVWLLYPRRTRKLLHGAVFLSDREELPAVSAYAAYLRREQKISGERLIILVKDDIMEEDLDIGGYGETIRYVNSKEIKDD